MQGANDTDREWLVIVYRPPGHRMWTQPWSPSTDWSQGGPLIEQEYVLLEPSGCDEWHAAHVTESEDGAPGWSSEIGMSALEAAMRAIVLAHLGDEVDVPEELT